jgi:hypothetical protein
LLPGFSQTMMNLGIRKAADFDQFARGGLARRHANALTGNAERFGNGRLHRRVRLAALRWRGDAHLERVAEPALDGIPRGRWDDLDPQFDSRSSLLPENAVEHRQELRGKCFEDAEKE